MSLIGKKTQKELDEDYNSGPESKKRNPLTVQVVQLAEKLLGIDEETLQSNKEDTLRKVRVVLVNAPMMVTPFIINLPVKMAEDIARRGATEKIVQQYRKMYETEDVWVKQAIISERKKKHDVKLLEAYKLCLKKARQTVRTINTTDTKSAVGESTVFLNEITPMMEFMDIKRENYNSDDDFDNACFEAFSKVIDNKISSTREPVHELLNFTINNVRTTPDDRGTVTAPVDDTGIRKTFLNRTRLVSRALIKEYPVMKRYLDTSSDTEAEHKKFDDDFITGARSVTTIYKFNTERYFPNPSLRDAKYGQFIKDVHEIVRKLNARIDTRRGFIVPEEVMGVVTVDLYSRTGTIESITRTAHNAVRAGVHAVRSIAGGEGPVAKLDRITEPLDNLVNSAIDEFRDSMKSETKDEIIEGRCRVKLTRVIAKCLAYGALGVITHPAIAAIAFLGKMVHDSRIDHNERAKVIADLHRELAIAKEKIKDADSKGDNENKYKLMRIENKLEREIARIKYDTDDKPE